VGQNKHENPMRWITNGSLAIRGKTGGQGRGIAEAALMMKGMELRRKNRWKKKTFQFTSTCVLPDEIWKDGEEGKVTAEIKISRIHRTAGTKKEKDRAGRWKPHGWCQTWKDAFPPSMQKDRERWKKRKKSKYAKSAAGGGKER